MPKAKAVIEPSANENQFIAYLTGIFASVEKQFRDEAIARYIQRADYDLSSWLKRIKEGWTKPEHTPTWKIKAVQPPQYVAFHDYLRWRTYEPPPAGQEWMKEACELIHPIISKNDDQTGRFKGFEMVAAHDGYTANHKQAKKDANDAVDSAKAHFISKQSKKLANAVGDRKIVSTEGVLSCNGVVTGHIVVKVEGGDSFVLEMDMITNCRYHPNYISFYQFPARFKKINIGATTNNSESEEWMAEHFGKKPLPKKAPPVPRRSRYGFRR